MRDEPCVAFLQWALPRLGLRWAGFRKVRRQVCRRVDRRLRALDLADTDRYRQYLEEHPEEWSRLDALCRIPISRFYRDRGVFDRLAQGVLPELASRGTPTVDCWSVGCASGEEPYTLSLLWRLDLGSRFPHVQLRILGTEVDEHLLLRAREGRYRGSSLRELPHEWVRRGFRREKGLYRLRSEFRVDVEFGLQDVRSAAPERRFDLILCRNLVFTYFDREGQLQALGRMVERLRPGGFFVIGAHEGLPEGARGLRAWSEPLGIYVRPA